MWYTHTRCAHSPQTVGGSTCSAVIKPSVTSAHSSIHAHRVAGVTAESERGSAEVRCHGVHSMSGTTAIVSVTSRSGPHAMIIAPTGSSRKGGSADVARPALYCGHSHPVMVDWHAPPRSHSHGVTAHSSCGSAPSAQSCAHDALAEEGAAPMMMRRKAGVRRRKVFLYYCRQDRPRRERGSAKRKTNSAIGFRSFGVHLPRSDHVSVRVSPLCPRTIYKSSDLPAVNAAPPHRSFLRSSAPERCRSPLRPRSFANSSSIAPLHAGVVAPVRDPFRGSRGPRQPPPP